MKTKSESFDPDLFLVNMGPDFNNISTNRVNIKTTVYKNAHSHKLNHVLIIGNNSVKLQVTSEVTAWPIC
jgi:hypothetical protein